MAMSVLEQEGKLVFKEKIDNVYLKQKNNLGQLKMTSAKDRVAKIKKIKKYLDNADNQRNLEKAMFADFKKPATEVQLTEILPTLGHIAEITKNLTRWMRPKQMSVGITYTGLTANVLPEPKGLALVIAPWNYPFLLAVYPVLYAIAAGCSVILKPSEMTPHTSQFMEDMFHELFQENEVRVFQGGIPETTHLLDKKWGHIFFTGSPMVGKIVMKAASKHLASVSLELGGKSPCVVDKTANLKASAKRMVWGKFVNAGQTCIAPDYLLIERSVKDKFLQYVDDEITRFYGNETHESDSLARIVSEKHFKRLQAMIEDAKAKGATIISGGETDQGDLYVAPTIIDEASYDMMVMEDEIFGPLLPVLTFDKLENVPEIIEQFDKPLSMYVCSSSKKNTDFLVATSTAGGTVVNDFLMGAAIPSVPFGGVNNSGIGKAFGHHGFIEFSNERTVIKRGFGHMNFLYPPYTPRIQRILEILKKIV